MLTSLLRSRLRRGIFRLIRQVLFLPLVIWYIFFQSSIGPRRRWRFIAFSVRRFVNGTGSNVSLRRAYYVSQLYQPGLRIRTCDLRVRAYLYLGDVLKAQGLFADAERLYRKIIAQNDGLGLLALGDLVLLQATWAEEFVEYAKDGIALQLELDGWRRRTFSEAIGLLEEAANHYPTNVAAW